MMIILIETKEGSNDALDVRDGPEVDCESLGLVVSPGRPVLAGKVNGGITEGRSSGSEYFQAIGIHVRGGGQVEGWERR